MKKQSYEIVIIGGGPAGLAAAVSAYENGEKDILLLERDKRLGGILNQCIHNGFGLHMFKEELTGPEYAARYEEKFLSLGIEYSLNSMVLSLAEEDGYKVITVIGKEVGLVKIKAKAVVLAMGCRERSRGALNIPGFRPSGIYSAGTAQKLVNIEGLMPGKEVVILGSGDIGLIMARRMALEGAKVKLVAEIMSFSGGLKRNIVQCLDDYDIPLKLSHTVTEIHGKTRLTGVTISKVDEQLRPIEGTDEYYSCDTLLLSVGLIPENELTRNLGTNMSAITSGPVVNHDFQTSIEGVFACGNVLHVHDLVDFVSEEAAAAGKSAVRYVKGQDESKSENLVEIKTENGVRYCVPQHIDTEKMEDEAVLRFRVGDVYKNTYVSLYVDENRLIHKKKQILAPGEMETIKVKKSDLKSAKNIKIMLEN